LDGHISNHIIFLILILWSDLSDHIIFLILSPPLCSIRFGVGFRLVHESFTAVERLTCILSVVLGAMAINAMFYGPNQPVLLDESDSNDSNHDENGSNHDESD
jgi:hypothetical protein